jgi:hypothetical protein
MEVMVLPKVGNTDKNTPCHNPEDHNPNFHCSENLKYHLRVNI